MKLTGLIIAGIGLVLCIVGVAYMTSAQSTDTNPNGDITQTSTRADGDETAAGTGDVDVQATANNSVAPSNLATFGAGCFWCTEAVFERLKGVTSVESGYSGGSTPDPTYEFVCTGQSGHAEVVQIEFDPDVITFAELLEVFWKTHDPTTLNQQGNDHGTQYRSVVFYHDEEQKQLATKYRAKLNETDVFDGAIVTEISPYSAFYVAEVSHQDYYRLNSRQGYCQYVVRPKVEKVKSVFKDKLKPEFAD